MNATKPKTLTESLTELDGKPFDNPKISYTIKLQLRGLWVSA